MSDLNKNQKEYRIRDGNVLVTSVGNYYYVDGVDVNQLRLPKEKESLEDIIELIEQILEKEF